VRAATYLAFLGLLNACDAAETMRPDVPQAAEGSPSRPVGRHAPTASVAAKAPARGKRSTEAALPSLVRGQSRIPAPLHGRWTVTGQTVTGDGVQAYADNDPALLRTVVEISQNGARWIGNEPPLVGACQDAFFDGELDGPALAGLRTELSPALGRLRLAGTAVARDFRFLCTGKGSDWGPMDEELRLVTLKDGRLLIPYSDNLLLLLERA